MTTFGSLLTLSSSSVNQLAGNFVTNFTLPPKVGPGFFIALLSGNIWFTTPNIVNPTNSNLTVSSTTGTTPTSVTVSLPTGTYAVSDIASAISTQLTNAVSTVFADGAVFSDITTLQTTTWTLQGSGYSTPYDEFQVVMSAGFAELTGWTLQPSYQVGPNATAAPITYVGTNPANISNGLTSFLVTCDAIDQSYSLSSGQNGAQNQSTAISSQVIYAGNFTFAPGLLIPFSPNTPTFVPLSNGFIQSPTSITITVTDQNGVILDFNQGNDFTNNASSFQFALTEDPNQIAKQQLAATMKQSELLNSLLVSIQRQTDRENALVDKIVELEEKISGSHGQSGGKVKRTSRKRIEYVDY